MRFDPETHTVHVGGRSWRADPAGTCIADHDSTITEGWCHYVRACRVRFESGWTASITWGSATYSSNYHAHAIGSLDEEPSQVEVGVIDHTGELRMRRKREDDLEWHDLETYLADEELVTLLDELATLPTDYDYGERPPTVDEVQAIADQLRALRAGE